MENNRYNNAPIVEAIFELKWQLPHIRDNLPVDNNYPIIIGALNEKFKHVYPFHEPLPTLAIPEGMAKWNVQHRFRSKPDSWPLYQIGPGIITLNFTKEYHPADFCKSLAELIRGFFEVYPNEPILVINELSLRYIDAIKFDYSTNVLDYLKQHFVIGLDLPGELFEGEFFSHLPEFFDVKFVYPIKNDVGKIIIRLARGNTNSNDVIIVETLVKSNLLNKELSSDEIIEWVRSSHEVTHRTFKILFKKFIERGDFN